MPNSFVMVISASSPASSEVIVKAPEVLLKVIFTPASLLLTAYIISRIEVPPPKEKLSPLIVKSREASPPNKAPDAAASISASVEYRVMPAPAYTPPSTKLPELATTAAYALPVVPSAMPNALSVPKALPEMFSIVTELAEPPLSAVIVKPSVRRLYFIVTPASLFELTVLIIVCSVVSASNVKSAPLMLKEI